MRDWLGRYVISASEVRAVATACFGIGLVLLLLALFSGLWAEGAPGVALLLVAAVVWVIRADDRHSQP